VTAESLPATLDGLDPSSVGGALVLVDAEASVADLDEAVRAAPVPVVGGLFPGVVHEGERVEGAAVVVELSVTPRVTTVTGLSDPETDILRQLRSGESGQRAGTTLVFTDAHADRVGEFVGQVFNVYGTESNFLGGGTGELDEPGPSLITPSGVMADAAVLAALPVDSSIGVKHGWEVVDGPFRVTESEGRTVRRLDGQPAFEVYRSAVEPEIDGELSRENVLEVASAFPFGLRRMNEETVVRDPYEVDEAGALSCFGPVPEGEFVHVLRGDTESLVGAADEATADALGGEPEAGQTASLVLFDCISRVLYLEAAFGRELGVVGGDGQPAFGALTIGEIANDESGHLEYYNKTAVVARLPDG
jgi:hypothetical protein